MPGWSPGWVIVLVVLTVLALFGLVAILGGNVPHV